MFLFSASITKVLIEHCAGSEKAELFLLVSFLSFFLAVLSLLEAFHLGLWKGRVTSNECNSVLYNITVTFSYYGIFLVPYTKCVTLLLLNQSAAIMHDLSLLPSALYLCIVLCIV